MKHGFKTKNYRINSLIIDSIIIKYRHLFKILLITSMLTGNSLTIINTSKKISDRIYLIYRYVFIYLYIYITIYIIISFLALRLYILI